MAEASEGTMNQETESQLSVAGSISSLPELASSLVADESSSISPSPVLSSGTTASMIERLHFDIFCQIVDKLDLISNVCLALAIPGVYNNHLKRFHPGPISLSLTSSEPGELEIKWEKSTYAVDWTKHTNLCRMVGGWSGMRGYRLFCNGDKYKFLPVQIYGDEDIPRMLDGVNANFAALALRINDYKASRTYLWRYSLTSPDCEEYCIGWPLPDPLGMGIDWYPSAFRVIEQSLVNMNNLQDWKKLWLTTRNVRIFKEHKDHWTRIIFLFNLSKAPASLKTKILKRADNQKRVQACSCRICAGKIESVLQTCLVDWGKMGVNAGPLPPEEVTVIHDPAQWDGAHRIISLPIQDSSVPPNRPPNRGNGSFVRALREISRRGLRYDRVLELM